MKAIVLAGGGGTRLWPLSTEDFPKQFLRFSSSYSLLQITVLRLLKAPFIREVVISTNAQYQSLVEKQLKKIDPFKKVTIVVEPLRKNTAPAIALAMKHLEQRGDFTANEPVLVLPSDHVIEPESTFVEFLSRSSEIAEKEAKIITFGIKPTRPDTGFGYIQIGPKHSPMSYRAERFVEKPPLDKAKEYVESQEFFWNAGIFLFSSKTFWQELKESSSKIYELCQSPYEEVAIHFEKMPNLSFDFATMEKSKNIIVCPLEIAWSDLGSWDSVYETLKKDADQNVKSGDIHAVDTHNCFLMSQARSIVTIGVEDLCVVETDKTVFITKRGHSQRVKELFEELKKGSSGP